MYFKDVMEKYPNWKAIQVCSIMNPWIDCVVFVPPAYVQFAKELCELGMNDFWDSEFEAYGDCLEFRLQDEDVPHEIVFGELNWDESNTTEEWDDATIALSRAGVLCEIVY